jgi:hypothetical protein
MIHQAVSRRYHFPGKRILSFLWGYKSAYCQLHTDPVAPQRAIVQLSGKLYMWLRLTFGGCCNPPRMVRLQRNTNGSGQWYHGGYLMGDREPDDKLSARESDQNWTVFWRHPVCGCKTNNGLSPPREFVSDESFIDDGNQLAVYIEDNVWRAVVAVIASIIAMARENNDDCIPRDFLLEIKKSIELGYPKKIQLTMGWICKYRTLMGFLPTDKFKAWSNDIHLTIEKGSIDKKSLEKLKEVWEGKR